MSLLMSLMITSLLGTTTGPSSAEQNEFTQLFAVTCMANVFSPDKLRDTLSTPLTPELPPERAAAFLQGRPGTAWEVHFGEGQYAIALMDSGFCSVFARKAPVQAVQEGFVQFVSSAPAPLEARKVAPEQAGPNNEDLSSTSYVWSRPGEPLDIVFTLTTSKAARDPEIQAMASVGLARPEP